MNPNYLSRVLLFICVIFQFSASIKAQSEPEQSAKLKVISNYDSFYVIVDESIQNTNRRFSDTFFDIQSGQHVIWVVTEFSEPFKIVREFTADSIHILEVSFLEILDEQSELYTKIYNEDSTLNKGLTLQPTRANLASRFEMMSDSMYTARQSDDTDYQSSYLKISTNVDSVYVTILENGIENTNHIKKIGNKDSMLVEPGFRQFTLSHEKSAESSFERLFSDSTTTVVNHSFLLQTPTLKSLSDNIATEPYYNSNLIIVSDEDSEIMVNGEYQGIGVIKMNMRTGPVDIVISNKFNNNARFSTSVLNTSSEKAIVFDAYAKPEKNKAMLYGFVPGLSQIYKRQKIKGYILSSSFVLASYFSLKLNSSYNNELDIYNSLEKKYNTTTNEITALTLGNQMEEQYEVVKKNNDQRTALFALTGAIYAYNIFDTLFNTPKGGYRTKTDINLYLSNKVINNENYSTLSLRYEF